jgi:hypothetical protein
MSYTTIRDEALEPFYIQKDQYCYTIFESIKPTGKGARKSKNGENYTKSHGHYGNFGSAVKEIGKHKLNSQDKDYSSIKEYLNDWVKIQEEIKELIKQPNI